jgi:ribosomal-protein-alanine N-acetyltransferase
MEIDDIRFVFKEEQRIFGHSLGEQMLYNEIKHNPLSHYFIALENDERVGYIGSRIDVNHAEILNFFVLEPFRKQGIGKALVEKVITLCEQKSVNYLSLEVREGNAPAIKLYQSLGFKKTFTRKNYYQDGEDAFIMVRKIGET